MSDVDQEEVSAFERKFEQTKKALKLRPNATAFEVANGYLLPLIQALHEDKNDDVDALLEELEKIGIPDEDLVESAKNLIARLGTTIEFLAQAGGFIKDGNFSKECPDEVKQVCVAAAQGIKEWSEEYAQALLADEGEEDDETDESGGEVPEPVMLTDGA